MCRWAAYRGDPLYLEELVSSPAHSLIEQSHCATRAKTATNGDGFGIAWYGDRPEPGRYRDVLPAWSDCNLKSLARTWARKSGERICRARLLRLQSDQAGRTSR